MFQLVELLVLLPFILGNLLLTYNVAKENYGWAFILFAVTLGGAFFAGWLTPRDLIDNPTILLSAAGIYLVIGAVWSLFKWFGYVRGVYNENLARKERRAAAISRVIKDEGYSREKAEEHVGHYGDYHQRPRPLATDHKGMLTGWIAYWPWGIASFALFDMIRKSVTMIYEALGGVYDQVAKAAFKE